MGIAYGANYGKPSLDLNFAKNKSLIDTMSGQNLVTFTRSSTGTYVDSDGLIKTSSVDTPRFDHNPLTGECLGLLIEESRTNSILYSEQFDNGAWNTNGGIGTTATVTANQDAAPDGNATADLIQSPGSASGRMQFFYSNAGTRYTLSVFVKKASASTVTFYLDRFSGDWGAGSKFPYVTYNFDTKAISTNAIASVQTLANGWVRLSVTDTKTVTGSSYGGWSGGATDNVYAWGLQIEAGSFPTSYIPTTGSTVTRSADVASITGTNFSRWYNQNAGTLFFDGYAIEDGTAALYTSLANVVTGSTFNTISFGFSASSSGGQLLGNYNGGTIINGSMPSTSTRLKLAMAMQTNDAAFSRGGAAPVTAGSFTTRSDSDRLIIGTGGIGTGSPANPNGPVSRVTYYPTRLQNFQLQQLTK